MVAQGAAAALHTRPLRKLPQPTASSLVVDSFFSVFDASGAAMRDSQQAAPAVLCGDMPSKYLARVIMAACLHFHVHAPSCSPAALQPCTPAALHPAPLLAHVCTHCCMHLAPLLLDLVIRPACPFTRSTPPPATQSLSHMEKAASGKIVQLA